MDEVRLQVARRGRNLDIIAGNSQAVVAGLEPAGAKRVTVST
ncbi:hypothetical protein PLANPX_1578 [Lacipirellula parvula]|uniref:Uncharacterized protein n=1 Tax=Lacipirellula parvula TaxID=2650471 RepID=A0A5K7XC93_9BACT|nr:hypothetical protein PLANPX_1578 [Lacipirellula parvula]